MKQKTVSLLLASLMGISALSFPAYAVSAANTAKAENGILTEKQSEERAAMSFHVQASNSTRSQREILAEQKFQELYRGAKIPENIGDSELYSIVNKLVYGELYQQGQLTDQDREMISLAVLTTLGTNTILKTHVYSALNAGLSPVEITETVYHCAPYIGAAKALEAIDIVNEVFKEKKYQPS